MPKPPTFQRPIPVNRNWTGRPGAAGSAPPFGKPNKKRPKPTPDNGGGRDPQLNIKLPKLPVPPQR